MRARNKGISDARHTTDRTGTLPVRLAAAVVEPVAVLPSRSRDARPATPIGGDLIIDLLR